MYKCNECNKEYENRYAFLGHCSSHKRIKKIKVEKKDTKSNKDK